MPMLVRGAMIMWATAAAVLLGGAVYAAEAVPEADSPAVEAAEPSAVSEPDPALAPVDQPASVPVDARPPRLDYRPDAPAPEPRRDVFRFDFAERPAPATGLRLVAAPGVSRTGWAFSGRAGPLRWLTPLDSEGQTRLRLGGRLPDQPRAPGLGRFNVGIHYSFE
jgi:hypothetical protein